MAKVPTVNIDEQKKAVQTVLADEEYTSAALLAFAKHFAKARNITLYFALQQITLLGQRALCKDVGIETDDYDE